MLQSRENKMVPALLILGLFLHICNLVQCQENYNNKTYYDDDDKHPCIHVNLRLTATINYEMENGSRDAVTVIGNNLTRAGNTCSTNLNTGSASINISWPIPEEYYSLNIEFTADFNKGWDVHKMELRIVTEDNPDFDTSEEFTLHNDNDLTVDNITLYKSYKCDSNLTHSFSSNDHNATASLTTTSLQLQAFQFSNSDGNFGSADMQCVEDIEDSKVLPIIIGTVITVVLVAAVVLYIIVRVVKHRRDSKQSIVT